MQLLKRLDFLFCFFLHYWLLLLPSASFRKTAAGHKDLIQVISSAVIDSPKSTPPAIDISFAIIPRNLLVSQRICISRLWSCTLLSTLLVTAVSWLFQCSSPGFYSEESTVDACTLETMTSLSATSFTMTSKFISNKRPWSFAFQLCHFRNSCACP